MAIRGARVLVVGACSVRGRGLVEAFLALGAHVIAADRLRTRLEELRAELRQHERLWVAETDVDDPEALAALFADAAREPLDAALLMVAATKSPNAWEADSAPLEDDLRALSRCASFVRVALDALSEHARGRILLLLEPATGPLALARTAALERLVADAAEHARARGVSVCALHTETELRPESVLAAADPERNPPRGFVS
jgi:NAD(P)-dependent dehydrogenase (short-subunit alcohol dehydrogenase family)